MNILKIQLFFFEKIVFLQTIFENIVYGEKFLSLDLGASSITGTLAVGDGGTGSTDNTTWLNSNNHFFKTISVSGQTDIVADQSDDTLTLVGAGGASISTDETTDTITITTDNTTYTAGSGLDLSPGPYQCKQRCNTTSKYSDSDPPYQRPD